MEHHHASAEDAGSRLDTLERQVARHTRSDRYSFFYGPMTVASVALTFTPTFEDVVEETGTSVFVTSYGSVWDMAADPHGGPAVIGLLLVAALVALLVTTILRPRSAAQPAGIAISAALIAMMLLAKPGTGDPAPELSSSGLAGLVLVIGVAVLAIAHAVQLSRTHLLDLPAVLPGDQCDDHRCDCRERPAS